MFRRLQHHWKESTRGTPGRRFRDRHERHRRHGRRRQWLLRAVRFGIAVLCVAIGLVLAFLPGPAVVFFMIAGLLLASEWLWVAKVLDWLEVRLRRFGTVAGRGWRRLPSTGRVALVALVLTLSVASTWGLYQLVR